MQKKEGVLEKAEELRQILAKAGVRVKVDDTDKSPGWKFSEQEMRGIPVRIECGPKDIEAGQCVICRRDTFEKTVVSFEDLEAKVVEILDAMQVDMLEKARVHRDENTFVAKDMAELEAIFAEKTGFVKAMWCGDAECESIIKNRTAAKSRCIPEEQEHISDVCVCCGKKADKMVIWGRQY